MDQVVERAHGGDRHVRSVSSLAANGASRRTAGFEAATSGSSESSVWRSPANVGRRVAQRRRDQGQRLLERLALAGDRPGRGARVGDQLRQLLAARGERPHRLRALDEQAVERRLVA